MRKGKAVVVKDRTRNSQTRPIARRAPTRKRTNKALQAAAPQYRAIIDSLVDDAIHVVDRDLRLVLLNETFDRWCDRIGQPRGHEGQSLFELFPFLPERVRNEYSQVFRTGKPLDTEETTNVGGETITTETRKVPIFDNGTVKRVITVVRDITERKRMETLLRQSEETFAKAFHSSPNLMAISTIEEGRMIEVNASVCRTLGYQRDEMVGKTTKELNIYAESGSRDSILRQLRQQGHVRDVDVTLRTHGGDILNCIFSAEIIEMNGRKVLLISVADITERKQAEATLHNAHRELERLVRERTSQLRALAERLTRVEQEERRRISQILHEDLQQMLVGAKYRLSGLMKHNAEQSVQSAVEAVAGILDQAIQVTRTIGMDLRPPVLHESGLGAALLWLADDMRHKFGLTVEIQADPAAEPASENLRVLTFQAVRELLFNVSKHAGVKDAQVQTSVDADSIRVVVKDRGSGFDVTVRRPADLGLFSIRERMEFVSGQMQVASAPGQGTCVTLTLPLR